MSRKEWPRAVYQEVLYGVQEVMTYVTGFEPQDTGPDTNFRHELNLHMVDILEIVNMCGERFKVSIPRDQIARINTVDDIVQCVLDLQVEAA